METRYSFDKTLVKEVQYDPDARKIIVDVQKVKGDRKADLSRMAYYMEKDVSHDPSLCCFTSVMHIMVSLGICLLISVK